MDYGECVMGCVVFWVVIDCDGGYGVLERMGVMGESLLLCWG